MRSQGTFSICLPSSFFLQGQRMPEPVSARPVPKLRSSSTAGRPTARPRPKTIHVDQDSNVAAALAANGGSRGNRGSSSNISGEGGGNTSFA